MMFNDLPPTDSLSKADTIVQSVYDRSIEGKWYGDYHDFNRSYGWLEINLKTSDSLVTGEFVLTEQELHGTTTYRGVISGGYDRGVIRMTVQFKDNEYAVFTGFIFHWGAIPAMEGCYDAKKNFLTSGTWKVTRNKQ